MPNTSKKKSPMSIFIVSGGRCLAAHTMVRSLLVQYPDNKISVRVFPEFSGENIEEIISNAKKQKTIIAHTLVRSAVRNKLIEECEKNGIKQVDYIVFSIINVTNKPIESSANEITGIITDRFGFNKQKINTIDY
jgi:regulator of PEP synthase PpsR (kinase-PPPase family)